MPAVRKPVKRAALSQRIVRKDGTVEDLGLVAYWHQSAVCRAIWAAEHAAPAGRLKDMLRRARERVEAILA